MAICGSCSGTGKVTCPGCGGRRYISRLNVNNEVDLSPCTVCNMTGKTRCNFCGGRGTVGPPPITDGPPIPKTDVLAGQWYDAQGNYYEITKVDAHYHVTEHGALGQTGSGTATLSGNLVTLEMTHKLFGRYTLQLKLDGDSLQGAKKFMGFPVPMVFTRR